MVSRVTGNRDIFCLLSKFMTSDTGQQVITIHELFNISRSKDKQTMKFDHLIKYNLRNIFLRKLELVSTFNIFWQPSTWTYNKTNCIKVQTVDPVICSILAFYKRVRQQLFHQILYVIFYEKCFPFYSVLIDQISLPGVFTS